METLKPCPWCNSNCYVKEVGLDGWRIRCTKGCFTFGDSLMSRKTMIRLFNKRAKETT